jgi:hypothetical protein
MFRIIEEGTTMRRMRVFYSVLASIIVAALTAAQAYAADASPCDATGQTVVIGRNNVALDVPAVQAAVDQGGSVLLTGTFDFGEAGRVLLRNDVEICGAGDESGAPSTIVRRGEWTFHTPYPDPSPLPPAQPGPKVAGPKVAIHNIHFVESRGTAIHLAYSGGASLRHNVINQMRARTTGVTSERAAIVVGTSILGGTPNTRFIPLLISGDIDITDNEIDVSVDPSKETTTNSRGTGMFVAMYVGADVRIERNFVTGNTRTGLAILDGIADALGRGSVVIADNVIVSDVRFGFVIAGPRAPLGIVTGFNNNRALGGDPNLQMIPALVTGNSIELNGVTSMGIVNIWNGAVITGNTITVHGDLASTKDRLSTSGGILATTSDQVLMHNRFAGEGCNAIRIGGTADGQERRDNVAIANNITHFQAFVGGFGKCADLWLEPGTHDNTVVGNSGGAIDDGVHNKVTGFSPVKGGVGKAVSEAEHDAHDASFGFE